MQYGILHNRKTAGTLLKTIIQEQHKSKPLTHVVCYEHDMTLPRFIQTEKDKQAIFFIREPISRFVSGFYSRLRAGKPRYDHPWKKEEARAFQQFKTPNALAESLSSWNLLHRFRAIRAMQSIGHVKHTYREFLGTLSFLEKNKRRIAYIGHQPNFDIDLSNLRILLGIDSNICTPTDDVSIHKNPTDIDKTLSAKAITNLQKWYYEDYQIYEWCLNYRALILLSYQD